MIPPSLIKLFITAHIKPYSKPLPAIGCNPVVPLANAYIAYILITGGNKIYSIGEALKLWVV